MEQDPVLRYFSCVLLRRVLDPYGTFWPRLDSNSSGAIRGKIMEIWASQHDAALLRKVRMMILEMKMPCGHQLIVFDRLILRCYDAQIAHVIATNASRGDWNDLIPAVLQHQLQ